MKQEEFDRLVSGDMQRLIKKGQADYEANQAKEREERALYNKKKQEPVEDATQYKSYSPNVRVANMEDNEHEVQVKQGNRWKKHWGTNSMSNNMATIEIDRTARRLAEKMQPRKIVTEKEQKAGKEAAAARRERISADAERTEEKRRKDRKLQEKVGKTLTLAPLSKEQKEKQEQKKNTLLQKMDEIGKEFDSRKPLKPMEKMAKGGKISLKDCSVSTHSPSKKSSNW